MATVSPASPLLYPALAMTAFAPAVVDDVVVADDEFLTMIQVAPPV